MVERVVRRPHFISTNSHTKTWRKRFEEFFNNNDNHNDEDNNTNNNHEGNTSTSTSTSKKKKKGYKQGWKLEYKDMYDTIWMTLSSEEEEKQLTELLWHKFNNEIEVVPATSEAKFWNFKRMNPLEPAYISFSVKDVH